MKRELLRDTDDEKKRRASTTTASAPSSPDPAIKYSETTNVPFQRTTGPAISQDIIRNQASSSSADDVVGSETRGFGFTAVLPLSSQHSSTTRRDEEPREDTRIQLMDYRIPSLTYGERQPFTEGSILRESWDGHIPLHDQNSIDLNLSFPVKLHMILSDPRYEGYVEWAPHGRAWKVLNPRALESVVIPKFFRSEKYSSFMRQVSFSICSHI
jgi:HSF-type DNA-binding